MGKVVDRTGLVYGRLYVILQMGLTKDRKAAWLCQCSCGNTVIVSAGSLRSELTQSCGCLQKERAGDCATKHGMAGAWKGRSTPEYTAYCNAQARCNNPKCDKYKYYGGRGIKFLFTSFEQFFSEIGLRPKGTTLDRINNNGNYEPGNVRWATKAQQNANKRAPNGRKIPDVLSTPYAPELPVVSSTSIPYTARPQ